MSSRWFIGTGLEWIDDCGLSVVNREGPALLDEIEADRAAWRQVNRCQCEACQQRLAVQPEGMLSANGSSDVIRLPDSDFRDRNGVSPLTGRLHELEWLAINPEGGTVKARSLNAGLSESEPNNVGMGCSN
jgi:hypothetical protein